MVRCRTSPGFAPAGRRRRTAVVVAAALAALVGSLLAGVAGAAPASADGPGAGAPWVVSLGDSYVSGEAGRWAGSTNLGSRRVDALGPTAYFDNAAGTAEQIKGCHRSRSRRGRDRRGGAQPELRLLRGQGVDVHDPHRALQARPGLRRRRRPTGRGRRGCCARSPARHDVKMVLVGIGGNDFDFATVISVLRRGLPGLAACCTRTTAPTTLGAGEVQPPTSRWSGPGSPAGCRTCARRCARPATPTRPGRWWCRTTPSPIPPAAGFRYRQTARPAGHRRLRLLEPRRRLGQPHGAGDHQQHRRWRGAASGSRGKRSTSPRPQRPAPVREGVGLYEEEGLSRWTRPGAVDRTEWVNQIRTVPRARQPYQLQESMHPNYWAQLAACAAACARCGTPAPPEAGRARSRDRPRRRGAQDEAELAGGCGGTGCRRRTSAAPGA